MKVLFIFMVLLYQNLHCQTYTSILKGKVTELNSQNKPIANVAIKTSLARSTATDSKGSFTLEFFKLPPGGKVFLNVNYKDWIVVNENDLNTNLPVSPNTQLVKIFMCSRDKIDSLRMIYYNISLDNIEKGYNEKVKRLKNQNKNYQDSLKIIEVQYNSLIEKAYDLADKFSRMNFDDISIVQQSAFLEFEKGNIETAIKILENSNPNKIITDAKEQKQKGQYLKKFGDTLIYEADSIIHNQISAEIFLARLYQLNFQWDSAETNYKNAQLADTTSFETNFTLADFLLTQNRYSEALKFYKYALNNYNSLLNYYLVTNQVAIAYIHKHESDSAKYYFNQAYKAVYKLFNQDSLEYGNDLLMLSMNTARFYQDNFQKDSARLYYKVCTEMIEIVKTDNSIRRLFLSISTYSNLLDFYTDNKDFDSANSVLQKSLPLISQLFDRDKEHFIPYLSKFYDNVGIKYLRQGNYDSSEIYLKKARDFIAMYKERDPLQYEPSYAFVLNNLGYLYILKNEFDSASFCLHISLAIRKKFALHDPEVYYPLMFENYLNLTKLYDDINNFDSTLFYFHEALNDFKLYQFEDLYKKEYAQFFIRNKSVYA